MVGDLGYENYVRPAGNACLQRDPSGVPTHHLENDHTLVALCRGMKFVKRLCCRINGGLETECHMGRFKIVINGFGDADDRHTKLLQSMSYLQRTVAADHDQHLYPELFYVIHYRPGLISYYLFSADDAFYRKGISTVGGT